MQFHAFVGHTARQHDDLSYHELHNTARIAVRRVEDDNAPFQALVEVYLIGADTECPDGLKLGSTLKDFFRYFGLRADTEYRDIFHLQNELVFVETARDRLDGVPLPFELSDRIGVDVLQEQYVYAGLRIRLGAREIVEVEEFIERTRDIVRILHDDVAGNVFRERDELRDLAGFFELVIRVPVADDVHLAFEVELFELLQLALVARKRVLLVEPDDSAFFVEHERVGEDILLRNAEGLHDGHDELLESRRQNENILAVLFEEFLIACDGRSDFFLENFDERIDVFAVGFLQAESFGERLGHREFPLHGGVRHPLYLRYDFLLVGVVLEGDGGQFAR